jgi:polyhydroxyalkanoate synthesis regulator phasin
MAKNADQEEPESTSGAKSRAEQLRTAVEGAFGATAQGAAPVQKRAQELADELVGAASRVRDVLEELRPPSPEELDALRAQVEALERRVVELERAAAKPKPKPKPKRA